VEPQSLRSGFNSANDRGGVLADLRTGALAGGRRRTHFPSGERHDRLAGGLKPPGKVARFGPCVRRECYRPGRRWPSGRPWTQPRPLMARAAGALGAIKWGGLFSVLSDRVPSALALPSWRSGSVASRRPSTRPVLKHGPRSLTCARVTGFYET